MAQQRSVEVCVGGICHSHLVLRCAGCQKALHCSRPPRLSRMRHNLSLEMGPGFEETAAAPWIARTARLDNTVQAS